MAERDFAEIARLSEKYSKDPKSRMFVQLADAYRKNGMMDEALDILNKGLQYHPDYALGYLILGKCYFDQRKYEQAKDAYETTLKHDPQNIVALRMIAQICESLRDEPGQMSAYKEILTLDPFDASAKEKLIHLETIRTKEPLYTISIAQEYEKQGDLIKALDTYEHLSFNDPSDLLLKEKVKFIKSKLSTDARQAEEHKIEELQVETFFRPDEIDLTPPEVTEPPLGPTETIQASELLEPAPSTPSVDDDFGVIELKEISEVIATPESDTSDIKTISTDDDQSLDIMQPVETQAMEGTIQNIDIITPTEEIIPETQITEETQPEETIVSGDLLEPVIESEDTQPIELNESTTSQNEVPEPAEELSILKPVDTDQPIETPITDQPPVAEDITPTVSEQVPETPSEEPPSEMTKEELPPEPAGSDKPAESQEKDESASRPKEEDFRSFQDWLSGLLK
ncbi:hypothetical protein A2Y85_00355 [candidate division WOR-3 bacterium RBG_13_43_14]|uniref:Uncharacterized protein n=1 Tax=candidate division WOR-3 bacterium RBG_13_43_14 TaxID=1802590 RepID=A0A1F4U2Z9_UNCW3|nr:MAG: hypothetical protein A2Y85_00355 [candidate division WOR-3 bacterium RBG_13_43_14]